MPKKSKRIASRHAQLSGRAKRVRVHGPLGIPTTNPPVTPTERRTYTKPPIEAGGVTDATPVGVSASTVVDATYHQRSRVRGSQLKPIETYFAPELRRIGLVAGVICVILTTLVFVL
ncbi:hypothetical protein M1N24_01370 [Dehalococcoidia bacterium]|nr:hypothetical protein [Dehalococcoidia bacterium]